MTTQPATCSGGHRDARRRGSAALLKCAVLLLAPVLTACEVEDTVLAGDDGEAWAAMGAFALTVLTGGVAMFFVFDQRFRGHDLTNPGARPWAFGFAEGVLVAAVIAAAVAFGLYIGLSDIDPGQKGPNIALWCVGSALGGLGALYGGRELAHWKFRNSADDTYGEDA